ncbi:FMN reductase [Nakamurella panacisegetis]|uniref:FMN reductase n=1 Tax=Nakamurella panacisegetis TaxID=1090615 RepID=A0A1H0SRW6_9ACTN|nr:FMN reductase [Nakamurella panacisegetis]SDP44532.1 FMN reductase [Nakamurella panacisegetis]
MTRIAVVSAGLSQPSSTRLLAGRLAQAVTDRGISTIGEIQVVHIELRQLAHEITNNLLTGFPDEALRDAIETVTNADALIAVTPVFSASYSGLFKSFFDVIDPDALSDKPTLIAATGGSARHSLVLEYALRPLMAYLRASTAPTGVFAATDDFGSDEGGASLNSRIDRAAGELVSMLNDQPAAAKADPFDLPLSFEELLSR